MKQNVKEQEVQHHGNTTASVVAGIVIGGLAGAGAALLFAPQSGRETREQIQQKTIELRDRTTETVGHAVEDVKAKTQQLTADVQAKTHQLTADVQAKTHKIATDVQHKVETMQHQGQEVLAEQLDHVAAAAQAGRDAITPEPEPVTPNSRKSY